MITTRQSGARRRSELVSASRGGPSNAAWIAPRAEPGSVLLLGGSSLIDFRVRVAQSHLRGDLLPSFWSAAGIIVSPTIFLSVPIDERLIPEIVPSANAIHECRVAGCQHQLIDAAVGPPVCRQFHSLRDRGAG